MKTLMLTLAIVLVISTVALASPYIICDPQTGITNYKITGPIWAPKNLQAQPDGSMKLNVGEANTGINVITVSACKGEVCSSGVTLKLSSSVTRSYYQSHKAYTIRKEWWIEPK